MSDLAKIKIVLSAGGMGRVEINGVDISHIVGSIKVEGKSGTVTMVTLGIFADVDLEVETKLDGLTIDKITGQKRIAPVDGHVLHKK